jgi:hypothetical protein
VGATVGDAAALALALGTLLCSVGPVQEAAKARARRVIANERADDVMGTNLCPWLSPSRC